MFHFSVRKDLLPVVFSLGGFWNVMNNKAPYLIPHFITPFNFVLTIIIYLCIFLATVQPRSSSRSASAHDTSSAASDRDRSSAPNSPSPYGRHGQGHGSTSGSPMTTHYSAHGGATAPSTQSYHRIHEYLRAIILDSSFYTNILQVMGVVLIVFVLFVSIMAGGMLIDKSDQSVVNVVWQTLVNILYDTPNEIFHINEAIVRMITTLFITCLITLYHFQVRKTYTLLSLAAVLPHLAISLYLLEASLSGNPDEGRDYVNDPYGGGIFYILNVVSYVSYYSGLIIDIVQASGENDFMNRIYANGTQQLLEKVDFMQKIVDKVTNSSIEVSKACVQLSSTDVNKGQLKHINTIQNSTNRALNLVDDIKLILAIETGDITMDETPFNIYSLIEVLMDILAKDLTNSDVELVFRINEDVPTNLISDPAAIIQVLLQLLKNAIKFMVRGEVGVIISKSSMMMQSNQHLDMNDQDDDPDVVLEISVFDSGPGMTNEQLDICNQFAPFPNFKNPGSDDVDEMILSPMSNPPDDETSSSCTETSEDKYHSNNNNIGSSTGDQGTTTTTSNSDSSSQGTGLGLFICYKIIKGLNGTLQAHNNGDCGLAFVMRIPFQEDNLNSTNTENPFALSRDQAEVFDGLPVLIIDDNSNVRASTEIILRRLGCLAKSVSSTVEGLRELKLATQLNPYRVVLVDNNMPGCDGLETMQMLKDNPLFSELKRVLLLSPSDMIMNNEKTGSDACIVKPLTPTNLIRGISDVHSIKSHHHKKKFHSAYPTKVFDSIRGPTLRVLVGESDCNQQQSIKDVLDTYNCHSRIVQDGATLISMAKKNFYDLLLVNFELPVNSGLEVTEAIRKNEAIVAAITSSPTTKHIGPDIQDDSLTGGVSGSISDRAHARRLSYPQLLSSAELSMMHRRRGNITIIGISNRPLSQEEIDRLKQSGMDDYCLIEHLPNALPALLAELEKKKRMSPTQKTLSPLTTVMEKKDDANMPTLSMSAKIGMTSSSSSTGSNSNININNSNSNNNNINININNSNNNNNQPGGGSSRAIATSGISASTGVLKSTKRVQDLENVISRFVPIEFQQLIAPSGMEHVYLGDAISKTITIFFSDIRDFTSTTEKMLVDDVIDFLNTYLAFAIPAITDKGGFIDKFIGDAIMAIFPHNDIREQAISAVKAAIGMMKSLDFMAESGFRFKSVETGIGINTGKTIIGIVGTETRMEPTALGDPVNLASRTEPLCKEYGSRILVTQFTVEAIGASIDEFTIRLVDSVKVKGKSEAVDIYEIIDGERDEIKALKMNILPSFNMGVENFKKQNYEEALSQFQNCAEMYPGDKPTLIFIQRCIESVESANE
ncbi:hypothetical protein SAMD00019534_043540 [Acytostelium subglobosum LB1]|uniref:hypothetical protein n=1 Tax=Acytostelium subglobosum LB1 TaxID=1410327 RepID=UPI0006450CC6|nr:hypothetical protein SAMD00019534_043540 [Acytostelium subglobosum LB1]GAM21179.1 hypothetical protein SAMD00019534_043540 [Acytostelium subglobosum LB1]|eukprot:XP_012756313.1 hypothetical protein SAMD00019534_043540 [Acytostelium subglobosum LB1]